MISEMVETRERIQNEFYEEFENMSQKFIGKPIDASVLYTLERYMEAVAQSIYIITSRQKVPATDMETAHSTLKGGVSFKYR